MNLSVENPAMRQRALNWLRESRTSVDPEIYRVSAWKALQLAMGRNWNELTNEPPGGFPSLRRKA